MSEKIKIAGGVAKNNSTLDFGAKGWMIIIFSLLLWFFTPFLQVDGLNIFVPIWAENGMDVALAYSLSSIASWIGIPLSLIFSWIMFKNNRLCIFVSILCAVVACLMMPNVSNSIEALLYFILVGCCINGAVYLGVGTLITNWFPTRKGTAIGWVTTGAAFNTAISPALWQWALAQFDTGILGLKTMSLIWGAVLAILAILSITVIKNTPEDANAWPDNDKSITMEEAQRHRDMGEVYKKSSPWTIKKLLCTKQTWIIALAAGIIMMITVGIISNFISILTSYGFSATTAVLIMSLCSVGGAVFSVIWGKVDATIGTKKATMYFYVIMAVAMILLLIPNQITACIACLFVALALGAGNNLLTSLTATVFGRYDFDKAWSIVYPVHNIVRAGGYALVGTLGTILGGFQVTFIIMMILSLAAILIVSKLDDTMIGRVEISEKEFEEIQKTLNR